MPDELRAALAAASSLDDLAAALVMARTAAGDPSFTQLARSVAALRASREVAHRQPPPGRVTVYDAFRPGRRRLDVDLISDLLRALGREDLTGHPRDRVAAGLAPPGASA